MDAVVARQGPLERAMALQSLISGEAQAGERLGRLTDRVGAALLDAGLISILVPERLGGLGASRHDFFDAVEAIAFADGSAGWCASVCNAVSQALLRGLPSAGREELFGHGPFSCWTSLQPRASFSDAGGGFRVSYRGTFGSGSSISIWALVAGNVGEPQAGRYRAFLLPKAEVQIVDGSWDVMGLRGTASIDYVIEDRFVPAHRSWEYDWISREATGPLSAVDLVRLNAVGLTAFALGVGRRALSELIASAGKTRRTVAFGVQAEDSVVQFGIGELDGRLRAGRSHLARLVAGMDEQAAEARVMTPDEGLELSQACITLSRAARDAAIFAFDHSGTAAIYAREPLQRCVRDLFTGLKHPAFTPAFLSLIGRRQLGLPAAGPVL
jgi:alkylation response protein AidB-like acyl-CoA dehydrogenase